MTIEIHYIDEDQKFRCVRTSCPDSWQKEEPERIRTLAAMKLKSVSKVIEVRKVVDKGVTNILVFPKV